MHAASECRANQNPEGSGQKPELRGQHRSNQRPGSGDGREMMPENHPAIGRDKIFTVVLDQRGSGPLVVQHKHPGSEPFGIKTIADREGAQSSDDDPERVNLFTLRQRQDRDRPEAKETHGDPEQFFPPTHWVGMYRALGFPLPTNR